MSGWLRGIAATVIVLVTLRVAGKIPEAAAGCGAVLPLSADLATAFLLAVLTGLFLSVLAVAGSRAWAVPASLLYLILPFFLFAAVLVAALIAPGHETAVVRGLLMFLALAALWHRRYGPAAGSSAPVRGSGWKRLLIVLLLAQGFLLFAGRNFQPGRTPFSDEGHFWYPAAVNIQTLGVGAAQRSGYSAANLHPLGVPFLAALPGVVGGQGNDRVPFFLPLYILFGLGLFLWEIALRPRGGAVLVVFVATWFAAFHNRSWAGQLMYALVYGEGVSALLVLGFIGCFFSGVRGNPYVLSLGAGLLALTKFPLIALSPFFFLPVVAGAWGGRRSVVRVLVMALLFVAPFGVLQLFLSSCGAHLGAVEGGGVSGVLSRLGAPNGVMLGEVLRNIMTDAEGLSYYFMLSVVAALAAGNLWRHGWPLLVWLGLLLVHYGYLYNYGATGDAASGLRYFLPAAAGMLLLGAEGGAVCWERLAGLRPGWAVAGALVGSLALLGGFF